MAPYVWFPSWCQLITSSRHNNLRVNTLQHCTVALTQHRNNNSKTYRSRLSQKVQESCFNPAGYIRLSHGLEYSQSLSAGGTADNNMKLFVLLAAVIGRGKTYFYAAILLVTKTAINPCTMEVKPGTFQAWPVVVPSWRMGRSMCTRRREPRYQPRWTTSQLLRDSPSRAGRECKCAETR